MVHKSFDIKNVVALKENVDIEEALDEAGHGRYNWFLLITCCMLNIGATIDVLGLNVIAPAASCDLDLSLAQIGLLTSITLAGLLTAIPWGYIADTRGRKCAMIVSSTIGFIISAIASFSTSFYMMLVLKFIGSCFSTTSLILTIVYLGENTCMKYRTRYLLILNVAHFGADFICFVLAYLILPLDFAIPLSFLSTYKSWRLLTLVYAFPVGLGVILMCFLEESPKFIADNGDIDKAVKILHKISKINNGIHSIYPVKSLMKTQQTDKNVSFWTSVTNQIVPIFQPPLFWKSLQLFLLFTICISTSNVFYMWYPAMLNSFFSSTNNDINFCQKIVANITPIKYDDICLENKSLETIYSGMIFTFIIVIANIIAVIFSNWKRTVIIGTCLISGISCIFVDMVRNDVGSISLFLMIQFIGVSLGSIEAYYIDIYPTSYRSMATSIGTMIAYFLSIAAVNITGAVIVDHCRITFYAWAICIFCGILLTIFLPANVKTS